jgi:hypothetical protein
MNANTFPKMPPPSLDFLIFIDRFCQSSFQVQWDWFKWLVYGGLPPAGSKCETRFFTDMAPEDQKHFRLLAARLIRGPSGGAAVQK